MTPQPGSPMMRRSFKSHAESDGSSGRGVMLWSIGGAVVFVIVVFVILARFSQPSNSAQPSWKNLVHTVIHPAEAFSVAKARIQHKPTQIVVAATPVAAPTTTPASAPTAAAKAEQALAAEAKKHTAVPAASKRTAASHKAKASSESTIASTGTNVASSNLGGPIGPIAPVTPAARRAQSAVAPTAAPDVVTDPSLLRQGSADYPTMARDQGVQGTTVVLVSVSSTGAVASASVAQSSGNKLLDDAALRAAYRSSFSPATKNGAPTASNARLVYTFSL